MTTDKVKWSYLAGLFDGEGCVNIRSKPRTGIDYRNNKPIVWNRSLLQISIANTKRKLMVWLVANFGGVYYTVRHSESSENNWQDCYIWKPKGKQNRQIFLLSILPYLVIKDEQAKLALAYDALDGKGTPEEYKVLADACALLNRRGKSVTTNTLDTEESVKIESDLTGDCESAPVVIPDA